MKIPVQRVVFRWLATCLVLGVLGGTLLPHGWSSPAWAAEDAANHVVISEFRTRGPAGGYDEFVELYNPTAVDIDIGGWQIWTSNNAGSTGLRATLPTSMTLPAGKYYLIVNNRSPGGYSGTVKPNAIFSNTAGFTDDGGIALCLPIADSGCDDLSEIVDQVGMSDGSAYKEDGPLSPLPNDASDQSYERKPGGGAGNGKDTDNNSDDFDRITPSNPQRLSGPERVIINEVAWAGTGAYFGDEWIELYNLGGIEVDLTGWRLEAADGTPVIPLAGTIPPGEYFLLERGDDNVVLDVTANQIYSSDLFSDAGETLYLLMPDRTVVDTANANGGPWPAGNLSTTASMERSGSTTADIDSNWITNVATSSPGRNGLDASKKPVQGTPGQMNWAYTVTATPSPEPTLTPSPVSPMTIIINEVAWAGTRASSEHEWIELYNPNLIPISLTGWQLVASDGSPWITFKNCSSASTRINPDCIVDPGGYFLLERTENAVKDVLADYIYSGSLDNDGEVLHLFAPDGTIVDTANDDDTLPWGAGQASGYYPSMERRTGMADGPAAWITNTGVVKSGLDNAGNKIYGTPREPNWAASITPTVSRTPTATRTTTATPTPPKRAYSTLTPVPRVVINEFVARAGHDWNNDGRVDVYDEYIEIYNSGGVNVNITGWKLDDEDGQGSEPFTLPGMTLKPGERALYYASVTGISLSDGGDTVRLLKPNGEVSDAYTYNVVKYPDQTWCRQPDGYFQWSEACFPSPGNLNTTGATPTPIVYKPWEQRPPPLCMLPDTVPDFIASAECDAPGSNIWRLAYWDRNESELWLYSRYYRWPAFFK